MLTQGDRRRFVASYYVIGLYLLRGCSHNTLPILRDVFDMLGDGHFIHIKFNPVVKGHDHSDDIKYLVRMESFTFRVINAC